ncbi:MAG: LysR family transcriptional regulator [Pseudomonadota bacterium]
MELRHLRYFVAVADEGHMTRAAIRLGIQQPPLSQQIQALESELGVKLFERTARSIRLNAIGKLFLNDAKKILALSEEAVASVKKAARGELGCIRIGYNNSSSMHWLAPNIISAFRAEYPLITLKVRENTTRELLLALEQEQLDIAFIRSSVAKYPSVELVCLHNEPVVVALPIDHRLAKEKDKPISLSELEVEDFVLCCRSDDGPGMQDALLAACHKAGFNPHVVEEVPRLISTVTLVAAGRGVSIIPETMQSIHAASVVFRKLDEASSFTVPLNLAYPSNREDKIIDHFIELAKKAKTLK